MNVRHHVCASILFDEFNEYLQEKYPEECERFGLHLEYDYGDGLILEYYCPEDDEGKSPFVLKNSEEIIFNELESLVGFEPDKIIANDSATIYVIQFER